MKSFDRIVQHYEKCLEDHLGTSKEVDWPNDVDAATRYRKSLSIVNNQLGLLIEDTPIRSLWDFGCGTGGIIKYLPPLVRYTGIDASSIMLEEAAKRYPEYNFTNTCPNEEVDFVICNGTFMIKRDLTTEDMFNLVVQQIDDLFSRCSVGLAVNFMDPHKCDWLREDLFFMSYQDIAQMTKSIGCAKYQIHCDYGLRESMTFLYK